MTFSIVKQDVAC